MEISKTPKMSDRRRFLSLFAGMGVATLAGCTTPSLERDRPSARVATESVTVGPAETGLTDDERERYVDRMADEYGSARADDIVPESGVSSPGGHPGLEPAALAWDDAVSLRVTGSADETIATADNYAALYETNLDGDGDDSYYLYWLWSCARPRKTSDRSGELRALWTHVDLINGGDVTTYAPGSDVTDNGTVGPHPDKTGQDTDEFAVRWQGERAGVQAVTGSCVERRDARETGFEWTVYLAGEKR